MRVRRASSVGSDSLLSRKSIFSSEKSFSTPARDDRRFERKLMMLMAGNGFRASECKLSIMQFDKLRARRLVSVARLSGISVRRLEDRSSECSVLARGVRLVDVMVWRPLSARLRCLRKRHLDVCIVPSASRFDVLCFGVLEWRLELELPDERLNFGVPLRGCA